MDHISELDLAAFVEGDGPGISVRSHLQTCGECRALELEMRALIDAFRDPATWTRDDTARPPRWMIAEASSPHALAEAPFPLVEGLLRGTIESRDITDPPTSLCRGILSEARARFGDRPKDALLLATTALDLARRLVDASEDDRAELAGEAEKDRANAFRLMGRFREALEALDRADVWFTALPVDEPALAMSAYVRATVLREMNRLDEALTLAQEAGRVFDRYGYEERLYNACVLMAGIQASRGALREARSLFTDLLETARSERDHARLLNNLTSVMADLGEADQAERLGLEAIESYRRLGLSAEIVRTQWNVARARLLDGRITEAVDLLRGIERDFAKVQMTGNSALVALDIVEGLLALDSEVPVEGTIRKLVSQFQAAGSEGAALRALAYLREVATRGAATVDLVRHVRSFVERSPLEPNLIFFPPPV